MTRGKAQKQSAPGNKTVATLFGQVAVKEDEPIELPKQFSIFKFVQDINYDKQYLYDETTESEYRPWTVNVAMSMFPDTLQHAVFLNSNSGLEKQLQHDYLFYAVPKRKRFKKDGWLKKSEHEKREAKVLEDTAKVINYSMAKTKQLLAMINEAQRTELLERFVYPDSKNSKK